MSATEVNAFVGLATFLVISITAVAAVVQLRHLRRANELDGLLSVLGRIEDLGFQSWIDETRRIVEERMPDPEFRRAILNQSFERVNNPWLLLANSYEWLGALVRRGLIPEDPVMDVYAGRVVAAWKSIEPILALIRRLPGTGNIWENFEYLYVISERYVAANPSNYPHDIPRAVLHDPWADADGVAPAAA